MRDIIFYAVWIAVAVIVCWIGYNGESSTNKNERI